jgi:anaerobic selenocysteine-containing dehydrogenase
VLVTVENGAATRIGGDPSHPFTRGFLCAKVSRYLERVYSPERLRYPLRRVGRKGEGRFERVSWEAALDEIAARLGAIANSEEGPQAILPYSYAGTQGIIQGASMDRRFFHRLGASLLDRTICASAGIEGYRITVGRTVGTDPEAIRHARLIVAWGANILSTNVHQWPFIAEARRSGARLVVIDPYRSRTAARADLHLAPHPGTDAALALGMMHVIIAEGRHDRDYVSRHTVGFAQLAERAREYPPERVAAITGLTAEEIVAFAREYAQARPSFIRLLLGLQRHGGGGMAVRTIACLPALVGAWRDVGGGMLFTTGGFFPYNGGAVQRPDFIPPGTRVVNMSALGGALDEGLDPLSPWERGRRSVGHRCGPSSSTTRIRRRSRRTRRGCWPGWRGRTCSRSCWSSSRPIRPTTPTSSSR